MMSACREDDIRELLDDAFQFRVGLDGILPNLVSLRGQVYLVVSLFIQNTGFLVIEIKQVSGVHFVLEENFIGAYHLCILPQARLDALTQANEPFDSIGWQEGVADNIVRLLANTIDAARALEIGRA